MKIKQLIKDFQFKNFFSVLQAVTIAIIISVTLYIFGHHMSAYILGPLIFFTVLIVRIKEAFPFRFMYPGLITFLFFMIVPICFTIYIAFTNLSTGHLLSKDSLKKLLISETYIDTNERAYNFKLYEQNNKKLFIVVDHLYIGEILSSNPNLYLTSVNDSSFPFGNYNELKLSDVFNRRAFLKSKKFIIPKNNKTLQYFRADKLIKLNSRYKVTADNQIHDVKLKISYKADDDKGLFVNETGVLAPGYFTNVGLSNFKKLFATDEYKKPFIKLFTWTFSWAFLSVLSTFILGLLFALMLNDKKLALRPVYRILMIIPYSIPFFISVLIFKGMLNQDFGIINQLISPDGSFKLPWLSDPFLAKLSCLIVNLWLGFPYMFLIITGILQSIPGSIYEAASLDGAGKFVQLRKLTLPLIMSSIGPLLVGSFAFNMNNFVGIYLLTGGGPPLQNTTTPLGETDILISYTYRLAFEGGQGQDFALASSISLIIFFIVATLTVINFKVTGMVKNEQA